MGIGIGSSPIGEGFFATSETPRLSKTKLVLQYFCRLLIYIYIYILHIYIYILLYILCRHGQNSLCLLGSPRNCSLHIASIAVSSWANWSNLSVKYQIPKATKDTHSWLAAKKRAHVVAHETLRCESNPDPQSFWDVQEQINLVGVKRWVRFMMLSVGWSHKNGSSLTTPKTVNGEAGTRARK